MRTLTTGTTGWMMAAALLGCGQELLDRTNAAEVASGKPGEIAIIPEVLVTGLEELTERTAGTIFVEEVVLHASEVKLWEGAAATPLLNTSQHFFLRYNPGAGEAGLTRLWTRANSRFTNLSVDVTPLSMDARQLAQQSRVRGFDVSSLADSSLVIRGMVVVPKQTLGAAVGDEDSAGAACSGTSCQNIVPDTAPADPKRKDEGEKKDDSSIVPDTAPAHDEVLQSNAIPDRGRGGAALGQKYYRPFVITSAGRFGLSSGLDAALLQNGGSVRFKLDVNGLLSDERLSNLSVEAARTRETTPVVQRVQNDEVSHSLTMRVTSAVAAPPVRPR